MAECWNILCNKYQAQPGCHDSCPIFLRASTEEAAPKRPSDFLIFNNKILGVPPGAILLIDSLALRPRTIMREAADTRTFRELNEQYPGFTSEPAFRPLVTDTKFVYYKGGLYIPADPHQYKTCPIFLRLLWHKEGDLTAADLVLNSLVQALHQKRSCADCERIPLEGSLLEVGLQEMLSHVLEEKVSHPVLDTQEMDKISFSVTYPSSPTGLRPQSGSVVHRGNLGGFGVEVQWPASFPSLPPEVNEKLTTGTLTVDDILPYLPVEVARQDIRIINGVIQVALYSTNGGYKQLWCWGNLEEVLERERKKREANDIDE